VILMESLFFCAYTMLHKCTSQSFRTGNDEDTAKNKLLFDLKTRYYDKADDWEVEEQYP
jgi:hypothetical protein